MKIALITDTHWGVRNDNTAFHDNTKRFLSDVFFPTLLHNGIRHAIHLGDLVDRRKYVNFLTAKRLREDFLEPLRYNEIKTHIIVGNHDTFYKNTNDVNALYELVQDRYDNISLYTEATTIVLDNTDILLLPWITDENKENTLYNIKNTEAKIALGHLEIQGFEMFKGSVSTHGNDPSVFDKFDLVCSGHFHHRSSRGNICYLGSHAEFTWSDYGDPRGFHILDTETLELEFIKNPYTMFTKVWYNDVEKDYKPVIDPNEVKGKMVKLIVKNKTNPYLFDVLVAKIEAAQPLNLQIVDDNLNLNLETDDNIVSEAESTIDIFKKYIDNISTPGVSKQKLESTIIDLYNEALTIE